MMLLESGMNHTQNQKQMPRKNEKNTEQTGLRKFHYEAVELRYQGKTYDEISRELTERHKRDFHLKTVASWFYSGGLLEEVYIDYSRKENNRRRRTMLEEMKKVSVKLPIGYDKLYNKLIQELDNPENDKADETFRKLLKDLAEIFGIKISPDDNEDGESQLEKLLKAVRDS